MKITVILPVEKLAVEAGVPPSPGDVVDLTGTARVEAVEDGMARLTIETLNDAEPQAATPEADEEAKEKKASEDEDRLMREAEDADAESYQ